MLKITLLLCLVTLAVFQTQAVCDDDFNKLCGQHMQGSIEYECDKSCSKFIVCFTMNDKPMGLLKRCPIGQYYDSSQKMCSTNKPAHCSETS